MEEILHHLGWCWNPTNNGINYQPQLVRFRRISEPSTGPMEVLMHSFLRDRCWGFVCWEAVFSTTFAALFGLHWVSMNGEYCIHILTITYLYIMCTFLNIILYAVNNMLYLMCMRGHSQSKTCTSEHENQTARLQSSDQFVCAYPLWPPMDHRYTLVCVPPPHNQCHPDST